MRYRRPINGWTFTAHVEQLLVPLLPQGDVVIMDALGSHKGPVVRTAIEAVGACLRPKAGAPFCPWETQARIASSQCNGLVARGWSSKP